MTQRISLGATLAAAAVLLAACSTGAATQAPATQVPATPAPQASAPATQAPQTAAASTCEVVTGVTGTAAQIQDFSFPSGLKVKAGDAITWSNGDNAPHTVTFDDGSCASGKIGGGSSVTVRYTVPGVYAFHCQVHPRMSGKLEVTG